MSSAVGYAREFFRRPRNEVYGDTHAETSQGHGAVAEAEMSPLYVIIKVGEHIVALDVHIVAAVVNVFTVHSLPSARRGALAGLMNYRGRVVPAVNVGSLMGERDCESRRAVIVSTERGPVALLVDATIGAQRFVVSGIAGVTTHPFLVGSYRKGDESISLVGTSQLLRAIEGELW